MALPKQIRTLQDVVQTMNKAESKRLMYIAVCSTFVGLSIGYASNKIKGALQPRTIMHVDDLNEDGHKDLIYKTRFGTEVPMYSVETPDGISYQPQK